MTERRKHPGIITDKELKEIKDSQIDPRTAECYLNTWINTRHLKAIVERLEAAEALEPYWKYYSPRSEDDEKEYDEKVEAWKKSRGE